MRDRNRLFKIYDVLFNYHKEYPDLRFMQILNNFMNWHYYTYKTDGFYVEDDIFIERFNEWRRQVAPNAE